MTEIEYQFRAVEQERARELRRLSAVRGAREAMSDAASPARGRTAKRPSLAGATAWFLRRRPA